MGSESKSVELGKDKNIPVTPNLQAFYPQVPYYYVSALQPLPINQFSWPSSSPLNLGIPQQPHGGGHQD